MRDDAPRSLGRDVAGAGEVGKLSLDYTLHDPFQDRCFQSGFGDAIPDRVWIVAEREYLRDAIQLVGCPTQREPGRVWQPITQRRGTLRRVAGARHDVARLLLVLDAQKPCARIEVEQLAQRPIAQLLLLAEGSDNLIKLVGRKSRL